MQVPGDNCLFSAKEKVILTLKNGKERFVQDDRKTGEQ